MSWGNFFKNGTGKEGNRPPKDAVIVPSSAGGFLEVWMPLSKVPYLYTAAAVDKSGRGREIGGEIYMTLDFVFRSYKNGVHASSVYTDQKLLKPHTSYAKIPTSTALRYVHHSPRVNAIAFNVTDSNSETKSDPLAQPDFTYHIPFSALVPGALLPRLIGLVESKDPECTLEGGIHSNLAKESLKRDEVFVSYFHAEAARESGEPVEEFIFTLVDALIRLNLLQAAADYINWYQGSGGVDPRIHLYTSRLYSLTGQPQTAISIIDEYLEHPELMSSAWIEHGRALLVLGNVEAAASSFEKSLQLEPNRIEALLGHGIALRNQHYHSEDEQGLEKSKASLSKICELGKFHVPEALHHMGTIAIALGKWQEAEECCRRTISLQVNPVSHRNLVISLHAQNKIEEARKEFALLHASWPQEAEKVAHYFSE